MQYQASRVSVTDPAPLAIPRAQPDFVVYESCAACDGVGEVDEPYLARPQTWYGPTEYDYRVVECTDCLGWRSLQIAGKFYRGEWWVLVQAANQPPGVVVKHPVAFGVCENEQDARVGRLLEDRGLEPDVLRAMGFAL